MISLITVGFFAKSQGVKWKKLEMESNASLCEEYANRSQQSNRSWMNTKIIHIERDEKDLIHIGYLSLKQIAEQQQYGINPFDFEVQINLI